MVPIAQLIVVILSGVIFFSSLPARKLLWIPMLYRLIFSVSIQGEDLAWIPILRSVIYMQQAREGVG